MAAHRRLDRRCGHLPQAFRNRLASLREQTEAAEARFQGLEARIKEVEAQIEACIKQREAQIKERERFFRSSLRKSKANSRKQRLKQMAHSVFGVPRKRSFLQPRLRTSVEIRPQDKTAKW